VLLLHEENRHRFAKKIDGRTCRLVAIPAAVKKKCIAFPLFKKNAGNFGNLETAQ
jgi:hypothetical protein